MAKANAALAQLRDIHLPNPISWWPLAPGWYFLMVIMLVVLTGVIWFIHKKNQQAKPKKQALFLLSTYQQAYEKDHNSQVISARISELLRRVALVYFPRNEVASLYGDDWIGFLNRTSKGTDFKSLSALLIDSPFKTSEEVNLEPLINAAKSWIKQRRVPCSN